MKNKLLLFLIVLLSLTTISYSQEFKKVLTSTKTITVALESYSEKVDTIKIVWLEKIIKPIEIDTVKKFRIDNISDTTNAFVVQKSIKKIDSLIIIRTHK